MSKGGTVRSLIIVCRHLYWISDTIIALRSSSIDEHALCALLMVITHKNKTISQCWFDVGTR